MARYVYISCPKCNYKVVEKYKGCEHEREKAGLSSGGRSAAPLATVFIGPKGEVQVPGQATDRLPKRLEKLGYRIETIQDSKQYSNFCKRMDEDAIRRHGAVKESQERQFAERQREAREELRSKITSGYGRDFLREAIDASERGYRERYNPGSHLEGFEYDSSHGRD